MMTIKVIIPSPEYNAVLNIRTEVFIHEQGVPRHLEIEDNELDATYFLTFSEDLPVATGRLRPFGNKIKFERIATLKEYRGKGVGRNLMKAMMTYAAENFQDLMPYMHSQASAVGFYERLGWQKSGLPFKEAGIPHQAMTFDFNLRKMK